MHNNDFHILLRSVHYWAKLQKAKSIKMLQKSVICSRRVGSSNFYISSTSIGGGGEGESKGNFFTEQSNLTHAKQYIYLFTY